MKKIKESIDKLRADAEDCTPIGDSAINDEREQSLSALAQRLRELAAELEKLAASKIFADCTVRHQGDPCDRECRPKSLQPPRRYSQLRSKLPSNKPQLAPPAAAWWRGFCLVAGNRN